MKRWIIPLMLGFGVTLAFLVGQKMSQDAMAVVIGVAVGVIASVPMSVILVALMRRNDRPRTAEPHAVPMATPAAWGQPPQPPMVLMLPGGQMMPQGPQYGVTGPFVAQPGGWSGQAPGWQPSYPPPANSGYWPGQGGGMTP